MQMNKYICEDLSRNLHPEVRLHCHSFNEGGRGGRIDTKYFRTAILLYYTVYVRNVKYSVIILLGEKRKERERMISKSLKS